MRHFALITTLAPLVLSACAASDATGPAGSLCRTRLGLEVCVNRSEVRQGGSVQLTVRNVSDATIFKDGCATKPVGRTSRSAAYEEVYNPGLRCGDGAGAAEIVAAMVELAPGEVFEETIEIAFFAFQGFYRVNVWVLDAEGALVAPSPAFSGEFEVFRTAD